MAKTEGKSEGKKSIADVLGQIEKRFGKGSIMLLSDKPKIDVPIISSGSIGLNLALGVGGYPVGRIVELYGGESSGKTTLTLHAIAECQKAGGVAAFIDAEHAFDVEYAKKLGVNPDTIILSQPDNGEQALEIADELIKSGVIDLIVVDSVAALVPQKELEGEMGDAQMGAHARLMSQALRKLTGGISKNNVLAFFINQTRSKIGVVWGNPETTTGGNALKFYASIRLEIKRGSQVKNGDNEATASMTTVKVVKNKVAPPFKVAEFEIEFGVGVSKTGEIIDHGVALGIIKKSGSWFSYGDTKLGQGRESLKDLLRDNPELSDELEGLIMKAYNPDETTV